ncbi:MAG: DUF58 domain-containing protein [bacterium]|jgi:hypothetical protein
MKKHLVISTTPLAGSRAQLIAAAVAIFTLYYRLAIPFFFLLLYLAYLLWSYGWTLFSSRFTMGESLAIQENIFTDEKLTWKFKFSNRWFLPLVRAGISFSLPEGFTCFGDIPITVTTVASADGLAAAGQVVPVWYHHTVSYAWLPEKERINVDLQLKISKRGVYYLPPPQLFVGDPSGLFRGLIRIGEEQYLFVFPRLKGAGDLLPVLALEDNERERNIGIEDPYQVQGVRDYQLTDSLKSINWYATTRTGSLKSNLYQRKESEYCLVVLDVSVAGQPLYESNYSTEDLLLENIISYAAGIALFHLEQGAKVAFYTNAPILHWEKSASFPGGAYLQRTRGIMVLDFATGTEQAQSVLKLCAAIEGNNRAFPYEQEQLWERIQGVPTASFIYIMRCHIPPASWLKKEEYTATINKTSDPASFYSTARLSSLASSRVKCIDLGRGEAQR